MYTYVLLSLGLSFVVATIHSRDIISQEFDSSTLELFKSNYSKDVANIISMQNWNDTLIPPPPTESVAPVVLLFYETMCPGCRKFDTTYFAELVSKLGRHLEIVTFAYGKAATTTYYNGTITFWCQHGEPECYGNKLHECANVFLYDRKDNKHLQFNSCLMEFNRSEKGSNDNAIDECGSQMNINVTILTLIKTCAKGRLGSDLLKEVGEISVRANYTSLPHLLINSQQWTGKHEDLIKDVCAAFDNPPQPCIAV